MDRYRLVLDIIERPEKYTSDQLAEIMSEPETRDIYNLLCKTESVIKAGGEPDINTEWEKFSGNHAVRTHRSLLWLGSRAASIAALVVSSVAAVAAGIAITVSVIDNEPKPTTDETTVTPAVIATATDSVITQNDSVQIATGPVMFENEPLEKIMKEIAGAYGVEVKFNNKEAALLHLYYKLDPSLSLNEVIEQLNTFEQINIRRNDNTLTID